MKDNIKNIKNQDKEGQEEQMKSNQQNINRELNDNNFLFDKKVDIEKFLSQKFEGLNEIDNFLLNFKEKNNEIKEEKKYNKNKKGCEEIFEILKKSWYEKSLKFKSPFKILYKPKKFSLEGRIIIFNFSEHI